MNSSRKERKKGTRRGMYRAVSPQDSSSVDSEDITWALAKELTRERSTRHKKHINYKEGLEDVSDPNANGNEYGHDDYEDSDDDSETEDSDDVISGSGPMRKLHQPLFKMVLDIMHGDVSVPSDQPKLWDLAAVCTEIIELEKQEYHQMQLRSEQDRQYSSKSPLPPIFIRRDAPSPPNTPISLKSLPSPHVQGSPPPPAFVHHQFIMTTPSDYYPSNFGHF